MGDCSGNTRGAHLVKEYFGRSKCVVVVYHVTDKTSLVQAKKIAVDAHSAGVTRVILFGNTHGALPPYQVDVTEAREYASSMEFMAVESSTLDAAVSAVLTVPLVAAAGPQSDNLRVEAAEELDRQRQKEALVAS